MGSEAKSNAPHFVRDEPHIRLLRLEQGVQPPSHLVLPDAGLHHQHNDGRRNGRPRPKVKHQLQIGTDTVADSVDPQDDEGREHVEGGDVECVPVLLGRVPVACLGQTNIVHIASESSQSTGVSKPGRPLPYQTEGGGQTHEGEQTGPQVEKHIPASHHRLRVDRVGGEEVLVRVGQPADSHAYEDAHPAQGGEGGGSSDKEGEEGSNGHDGGEIGRAVVHLVGVQMGVRVRVRVSVRVGVNGFRVDGEEGGGGDEGDAEDEQEPLELAESNNGRLRVGGCFRCFRCLFAGGSGTGRGGTGSSTVLCHEMHRPAGYLQHDVHHGHQHDVEEAGQALQEVVGFEEPCVVGAAELVVAGRLFDGIRTAAGCGPPCVHHQWH